MTCLAAGEHYCGLTYQQLQPLVTVLQEKVHDLANVLLLELPEQQSYLDLLLAARERLADETILASSQALLGEQQLAALATQLQAEVAQAAQRRGSPKATAERLPAARELVNNEFVSDKLVGTSRTNALPAAGLPSRLAASLQCARQHRTPLTLALFELDRFSDLLVQLGPTQVSELASSLCAVLGQWMGGYRSIQISDSQIAVICDDCARRETVENVRSVLRARQGLVAPGRRGSQ